MTNSKIGELFLNHFEKYLSKFANAEIFASDDGFHRLQIISYLNVFEGCVMFASFGLSKCYEKYKKYIEVYSVIDSPPEEFSYLMSSVLLSAIENKFVLKRGTAIRGLSRVSSQFVEKYNKQAIYFTRPHILPEEFRSVKSLEANSEIFQIIFITDDEYKYIIENGVDKFEVLLDSSDIDVFNLHRSGIIK